MREPTTVGGSCTIWIHGRADQARRRLGREREPFEHRVERLAGALDRGSGIVPPELAG